MGFHSFIMALVNIQNAKGEYVKSAKNNDTFSEFAPNFRWADDLDFPSDEILVRVKYERYL